MKIIAYIRVSTKCQEVSGLGIDAQRALIRAAFPTSDIVEFCEVESGRKSNRVELQKAIEAARAENAVLVVAKLDRLSRSVSHLFQLRDAGVEIHCCDIGRLDTLSLGFYATFAQREAELISERTRAALAEKKRAGAVLGSPQNLTQEARKKGAQAMKEKARTDQNNMRATVVAKALSAQGQSLREIAKTLNAEGFRTPRNCFFEAATVQRLLKR